MILKEKIKKFNKSTAGHNMCKKKWDNNGDKPLEHVAVFFAISFQSDTRDMFTDFISLSMTCVCHVAETARQHWVLLLQTQKNSKETVNCTDATNRSNIIKNLGVPIRFPRIG